MTDPTLIAPFTLAAAAFQSLLFTALLITFIHPAWSTRRRIGRHLEEGTAFKNIEGSAIYSFTPLRLNGGSFSGNGIDLQLITTQSRVVFAEFAKWPAVDGKLKLVLAFIPSGSTVAIAAEGYALPNADGFSLEDIVVPEGSPRELVLEDGAIKIKGKKR